MQSRLIFSFIFITLLFQNCTKEKRFSNRLDGKTWQIVTLQLNGQNWFGGQLEFGECKIYNELCTGKWKDEGGGVAEFYWQFNEKAKKFQISNKTSFENAFPTPQIVAAQRCLSLSGKYQVVSFKKNSGKRQLSLESEETYGFPGDAVILILEEQ